jgi:hypothetical protein
MSNGRFARISPGCAGRHTVCQRFGVVIRSFCPYTLVDYPPAQAGLPVNKQRLCDGSASSAPHESLFVRAVEIAVLDVVCAVQQIKIVFYQKYD